MAALAPCTDRAGLIERVAQWLYDNPDHPRPTIPNLGDRFDLTPKEAAAAIRRSWEIFSEAVQEAREHCEEGGG